MTEHEPWVMPTYPKIDTYYNRGEDFTVDLQLVRRPEFAAIDRWIFTEKIDGTNIRIGFKHIEGPHSMELGGSVSMQIGGRTNNAQLPRQLEEKLQAKSNIYRAYAEAIMLERGIDSLVLFGEGYGPKIQKGGGNYRGDQDFILFDVLVNETTWLDEAGISQTAEDFGIDRVPTYRIGAVNEAIWLVQGSDNYEHHSLVAEANGSVAEFEIEGVVARPLTPLYDGRGRRVMWKLKGSDFRAGKR